MSGSLSTGKTRSPDTVAKTGFYITDCHLHNCFDRLSNFQDELGRRMVLEVDWSYLGFDLESRSPFSLPSDTTKSKLDNSHRYIQQNFMENIAHMVLAALNEELDEDEQEDVYKEAYTYLLNSVSKSKILKNILSDKFIQSEFQITSGSSEDQEDLPVLNMERQETMVTELDEKALLDYEHQERLNRQKLLVKASSTIKVFDVELINQHGAYWGSLVILKTSGGTISREDKSEKVQYYLYFISKNYLLEDTNRIHRKKYHFRSFPDIQKRAEFELLINLEKVTEVL